jgi:hypothetical protein
MISGLLADAQSIHDSDRLSAIQIRQRGSVTMSRLMRSDRYCSRMTGNPEVITRHKLSMTLARSRLGENGAYLDSGRRAAAGSYSWCSRNPLICAHRNPSILASSNSTMEEAEVHSLWRSP